MAAKNDPLHSEGFMPAKYVGRLACEFNHSPSHTELLWFAHYLESMNPEGGWCELSPGRKKRTHDLVLGSESFDYILRATFPNFKRYGLEGRESLLPALDTLFSIAAQAALFSIRLMGKPVSQSRLEAWYGFSFSHSASVFLHPMT